MQLIPAIDLLDGRCVRLLHGDFGQVNDYPMAAAELADAYAEEGAEWLHVVDLAASRDGAAADTTALFNLLGRAGQSVQTGGGVRSAADISRRLDAGAARVVVGSLCVTDSKRFAWLAQFDADNLVAALDIRIDAKGVPWPRIHGWTDRGEADLGSCSMNWWRAVCSTCCAPISAGMARSAVPTPLCMPTLPGAIRVCGCRPRAVSAVLPICNNSKPPVPRLSSPARPCWRIASAWPRR